MTSDTLTSSAPAMSLPSWTYSDPEFLALAARLDTILEQEHRNTLQLICFNNPASEVWQPLPETCEGVDIEP